MECENTKSLQHSAAIGTLWSGLERFSVQGVAFIITIIMARILTPSDYGLVGMLTVFIAISQSLVDCGFSQALIRKQDRSEIDISTVFYFNIGVGFLLYIILFFLAPFIAALYEEPLLIPLTRVISLCIPINSLVVVQRALLLINIDFRTQAKASLTAAVFSGIVGIIMAYSGCGVWSIVWYQIINFAINAILLWFFSKWRPMWKYSWASFVELFGFGSKLAISGIIDTLYNNVYIIIIGKVYKASDLGYFTRAQQFASFPSSNITGIIQRVTFPVLCAIQNDDDRLRTVYRRFIRVVAFIIFPLMIGLAVLAKPLVIFLLKEQWAFSATLLSVLCFSMMWYPIHAINLNILQVKGRSDLFLKLEIIKKCVGVVILCITVPLGLISMCIGTIISSAISLIINTYYTERLIKVGFCRQMCDLSPTLFYSLTMGLVVYVTISFIPYIGMQLAVGAIVGVLYYLLIAKLTKSRDLKELQTLVLNII